MLYPKSLYLYRGEARTGIHYEELVDYLQQLFSTLKILPRDNIFRETLPTGEPARNEKIIRSWARRLAALKIVNPAEEFRENEPFPAEIKFEIRKLTGPEKIRGGPLYEGVRLSQFLSELISASEPAGDCIHLIITDRLFATWDENDRRYHARVSIYSFPSIISTAGIVEAPAKPREFYLKLRMGFDREALKEEFSGRFIDYDDPRLTEVLKGYLLQAILFHLQGEPFCPDPNCRLYNAHFQEEVLRAQLYSPYEFCPRHREIMQLLNSGISSPPPSLVPKKGKGKVGED